VRYSVAMDAHPSHEIAFAATLTPRQRRLGARLEGFGDIVFGFAVSQCALQLPNTDGHVDLAHPLALLLYFATFALVASLWLIFHRLLSGAYVASGIDLLIAFAYLALVSLIPYAMYGIAHGTPAPSAPAETIARARSAVGAYTSLYALMTLLAAILSVRNLRRGYAYFDAEDRRLAWLTFLRQAILCAMMSGGLAIDRFFGPSWAGLELAFIGPAIALARLVSRVPSSALLRAIPAADLRATQPETR
jgi:uncharacterized membrane protein